MKKQMRIVVFSVLLVAVLFSVTARADITPKPSVCITFENMGSELCYGTLLSESSSTGPLSAWDGTTEDNPYEYSQENKQIWNAFLSYEDPDGFYFLQEWWICSETHQLDWTYYPPETFKILLYYPETETFVVSGIYERYAFDSYFTVDMNNLESDAVLVANTSYEYTWEFISLLCRLLFTIALEIGIAVLFGFRRKKLLIWITGINVITQVILNVLLNAINYHQGSYAFVAYYLLFEVVVFVIEAICYAMLFPKAGQPAISRKKAVLYAFVANACSFAGGMLIARAIPGIF